LNYKSEWTGEFGLRAILAINKEVEKRKRQRGTSRETAPDGWAKEKEHFKLR